MVSTMSLLFALSALPSSQMTCWRTVSQCDWRTCPRSASSHLCSACLQRVWPLCCPLAAMAWSSSMYRTTQTWTWVSWMLLSQPCCLVVLLVASTPPRSSRSSCTWTARCWRSFLHNTSSPSMTTSACVSPVRIIWSVSQCWSLTVQLPLWPPTQSCSGPSTL